MIETKYYSFCKIYIGMYQKPLQSVVKALTWKLPLVLMKVTDIQYSIETTVQLIWVFKISKLDVITILRGKFLGGKIVSFLFLKSIYTTYSLIVFIIVNNSYGTLILQFTLVFKNTFIHIYYKLNKSYNLKLKLKIYLSV